MIRPESCRGIELSKSLSNSSAAGTKGSLDLSFCCCVFGVDWSRSWWRCSGTIARRARYSVALFLRSSERIIPARTKDYRLG